MDNPEKEKAQLIGVHPEKEKTQLIGVHPEKEKTQLILEHPEHHAFKDIKWPPMMMPICAGVLLYFILTHLGQIGKILSGIGGYFAAVLLGCVLAYMMNPLAMFFQRTLFKNLKRGSWSASVALTVISLLTLITLLLVSLTPQLVMSVTSLFRNLETYVKTLEAALERIFGSSENAEAIIKWLEPMLDKFANYMEEHSSEIISKSAGVLKSTLTWLIALILSIYLLAAKSSVKAFLTRFFKAALPEHQYTGLTAFLTRCDSILIKYVIYSLLECILVGSFNAVFMLLFRMQYVGLVSVVVALTNLVPTFGPIIGAAIGAFILLMTAPWHALVFLIFTVILQIIDGYIVKPKLFGDTLGVSGLLILISVVVMGNMFGVIGILLAIPTAAILDFVYDDSFLPMLEKRRKRKHN